METIKKRNPISVHSTSDYAIANDSIEQIYDVSVKLIYDPNQEIYNLNFNVERNGHYVDDLNKDFLAELKEKQEKESGKRTDVAMHNVKHCERCLSHLLQIKTKIKTKIKIGHKKICVEFVGIEYGCDTCGFKIYTQKYIPCGECLTTNDDDVGAYRLPTWVGYAISDFYFSDDYKKIINEIKKQIGFTDFVC